MNGIKPTNSRQLSAFSHDAWYTHDPTACDWGLKCPHFKRVDSIINASVFDRVHCAVQTHGPDPVIPFEATYEQLAEMIAIRPRIRQYPIATILPSMSD